MPSMVRGSLDFVLLVCPALPRPFSKRGRFCMFGQRRGRFLATSVDRRVSILPSHEQIPMPEVFPSLPFARSILWGKFEPGVKDRVLLCK